LPLGCYFFLDKKVTKKSRQKKASTRPAGSYAFSVLCTLQRLNRHSRHTPGPLFCHAFTRFCFGIYFDVIAFIVFPVSRTVSGEIGQNNGGLVWWQGHSNTCRSGGIAGTISGARFCRPSF
jgi:hypothetical protein